MIDIKAIQKNNRFIFVPKKKNCKRSVLWCYYLNEDKKKDGVNHPVESIQLPLFCENRRKNKQGSNKAIK
tara:strand:- start:94 stop:303 length:210 start_codon:yes stop_codon:yes gene_type:complete